MTQHLAYVITVTDGTVVEYAPEIYVNEDRATEEAERWAWILAGGGWAEIARPFEGRWEVAGREVRLTATQWTRRSPLRPWVCIYWSEDGVPDPGSIVLWGREAAVTWVLEPPHGLSAPAQMVDWPWMVAAAYHRGGEESYAMAHLAKLISD